MSNAKNRFYITVTSKHHVLRSRSKVKVNGHCQPSGAQRSILGPRPCQVQRTEIGGINSNRCLCVCNHQAYADNCADAVDRLLINWGVEGLEGVLIISWQRN